MSAHRDEVDPYSVLGVSHDASPLEIRRAYRRLARRQHPDLNARPDGPERFVALTRAYELLNDSAARARYDDAVESRAASVPPGVKRVAARRARPADPSIVRRGILDLSPEEVERLSRGPLRLSNGAGFAITLPAGTRDGDQLTLLHHGHVVLLSVRVPRKDLTARD
jgi:curved DNA-binding protein CbpA